MLLALLLFAAPAAPAASGRATEATHFAVVHPAAPARPHLDLGPVVIREGARPRTDAELQRELDLAGRELHADGFIYEARDVREVYAVNPQTTPGKVAWNVATLLLAGRLFSDPQPSSVTITSFYRAFRFVPEVPPRREVQLPALAPDLARELASAKDLSAQLLQAHQWFVTGRLELALYVALRRQLIA